MYLMEKNIPMARHSSQTIVPVVPVLTARLLASKIFVTTTVLECSVQRSTVKTNMSHLANAALFVQVGVFLL